ncbi:MAG: hypothetical protein APR55_10595 [Methanolinea sp. SDB]|nr:MAG: hypothetical protein APR55_10595 [Methanolinea sp. SDB]
MLKETSISDKKETPFGLLPKEWLVTKLGDHAKIIMGQSPPGISYNEAGDGIPFLQGKAEFGIICPSHKKYTNEPKKIAPRNTILISVRAPVGDVNVADIDYCIGRGLASISLSRGDNLFLFYLLYHLKDIIEQEGRGSTFKSINKRGLMDLTIPLPPLSEQKAIAHLLRTVQDAREKTEAVIEAAKTLKKSMMHYLFTYGPVPIDEAEQLPLKETEVGMVPEGWGISKLGDIAKIGNGSTPKKSRTEYWENGKIPWLTSKKIHESIITHADEFITNLALDECHMPLVKKCSILIAITGQGKTLGNAAIVTFDTRINQHLAYIALKGDSFNPEFVLYFLQSRYRYFRAISSSGGSTKGALTCGFLKTYPIPKPDDFDQGKIIDTFYAINKKIAAEESRKAALDQLFQTLLHDLMTAKIRVDHISVPVAET